MEIKATAKFVRISPQKVRPYLKDLRTKPVPTVLQALAYVNSKPARLLSKLIHSALSNAKNNYNLKEDNLKILTLTADAGPSYRRYWYRSHGSADRLLKRTSNLSVVLSEIKPTLVKKAVAKSAVPGTTEPAKPADVSSTTPDTLAPHQHLVDNASPKRSTGVRKIFTRRTTNK